MCQPDNRDTETPRINSCKTRALETVAILRSGLFKESQSARPENDQPTERYLRSPVSKIIVAWEILTDTRCNRCCGRRYTRPGVCTGGRSACVRARRCVGTRARACYAPRREPICLIYSPVPRVMDIIQSRVTDEPAPRRGSRGIGAGGVSKFLIDPGYNYSGLSRISSMGKPSFFPTPRRHRG